MTKKRPSSMSTHSRYYLRDVTSSPEGYVVWWRPGRSGYTTNLPEAGVYEADEALSIEALSRGETVAVHTDTALKSVSQVVPVKMLEEKLATGRGQRVAYHLKKLNEFLALTERSLQDFQDKLTRISTPPTDADLQVLGHHVNSLQNVRFGAKPHLKAVRFLNEEEASPEMLAAIARAEALGIQDGE